MAGSVVDGSFVCNGVVVAVFCGDFDFRISAGFVDFEDLGASSELLQSSLTSNDLCMLFSSLDVKDVGCMNQILSSVHNFKPDVSFWGGQSVSPKTIVTNDGMFENYFCAICISGLKSKIKMYTGFSLDKSSSCYTVTKSSFNRIYELDGENAAEKYCLIQKMKPWLLNSTAGLVMRHDISKLMKNMANLNKTLYDGILKSMVKLLGFKINGRLVTAVGVTHVDNDYIKVAVDVPEGTELCITNSSEESQLSVYDDILKDYAESKCLLISSCLLRQYYIDFNFDEVVKKLDKLNAPYLLNYFGGEYGFDKGNNPHSFHQNCSDQVLGFK